MNRSLFNHQFCRCAEVLKNYGKASDGSVTIEYALLIGSMLGGVTLGAFQLKDNVMDKGYNEVAKIVETYPKPVNISKSSTVTPNSPVTFNSPASTPSQPVPRTTPVKSLVSQNSPIGANSKAISSDVTRRSSNPLDDLDPGGSSSYYAYDSNGESTWLVTSQVTDDGGDDGISYLLDEESSMLNLFSSNNLVFAIAPEKDVPYVITFDLNQRINRNYNDTDDKTARDQGSSMIDVYYAGQLIDTIRPPQNQWQTYSYAVLGGGTRVEVKFVERNVDPNVDSAVLLDNVYTESGEFINGGPDMNFTGTSADNDITVTFGDLQGSLIEKEYKAPASS